MDVLLGKVAGSGRVLCWIVKSLWAWLMENGRTPNRRVQLFLKGHRAFARKTFFLHPFEPSDCHELRSNRHHVCCWVREGRQYGNKDVLNSVTCPRSTSSSSVFAPRLAKRLSREPAEPCEKSSRWSAFMQIFFEVLQVPQFPSFAEPPPAEVLPEPTATDGPVPVLCRQQQWMMHRNGRCNLKEQEDMSGDCIRNCVMNTSHNMTRSAFLAVLCLEARGRCMPQ